MPAPRSTDPPRDSIHDFHSLMASSNPIVLKFIDVCYKVKLEDRGGNNLRHMFTCGPTSSTARITERTILNGITGMAPPGEILAVLGPSGSGKSTLLNALAGRLQGHGLTGTVLANGRKLSKLALQRTGFVAQDDVFYPHLTVRETLVFCSLLRLPNSLSRKERIAAADSVIAELGLAKCENTIVGNAFVRGVSGGERKRVSIAHEMLINPSVLVLDEPTSGLDSTAAYRVVATLGAVAEKGKTVVMSVHQPSSRVYQMFDSVLVLSEGRCLYFGKGDNAVDYFKSVGFSPSFAMNPADFLLDLANGVCHIDGVNERSEKPNVKQSLVASYNTLLAPQVKAACLETTSTATKNQTHVTEGNFVPREPRRSIANNGPSTWFSQFTILLQRSLKERRHEAFNSLRVFQVLAGSVLAGSMWWHSEWHQIQDHLGLLFFISIFWGVLPSFNAVFAFPQDRAILRKERASGMYTLSPYFMARTAGDIPMELVLPTVFISIAYWMTSLKPEVGSFLLTLLVLVCYVLASQSLGLAIGALIMDAKQAATVVTVAMLAFVLTGGFYVHKMPCGMAWTKYLSTTFYCYRLLINVQYGDGKAISDLLGCFQIHGSNYRAAGCKFVEEDVEGQIRPAVSTAALLLMLVGYRLLAYVALRRIKV